MEEYLRDSRSLAYSQTYIKTCLQKHFGDELLIKFADGKPNVVKFKKTAAAILNAFHEMEKTAIDVEADKLNVIKTAAECIKSDIKLLKATSETHPQVETEAGQHTSFLFNSL